LDFRTSFKGCVSLVSIEIDFSLYIKISKGVCLILPFYMVVRGFQMKEWEILVTVYSSLYLYKESKWTSHSEFLFGIVVNLVVAIRLVMKDCFAWVDVWKKLIRSEASNPGLMGKDKSFGADVRINRCDKITHKGRDSLKMKL